MKGVRGEPKCAEPGCLRPSYALGYCEPAYRRLVRAAAKQRAGGPKQKPEPRVALGVRVAKSVVTKLASTGEAATTAARKVLEGWAAARR